MVKTVVVLGAAFGGLGVAHRLLKYTRQTEEDIRVILVSKVRRPSTLIDITQHWEPGRPFQEPEAVLAFGGLS
ncbi:uncharacterized protein ColSpa_05798 [Colletotrichum spaethianum]|uniref:Uncharacterized protein n=1 Tax=Colletotrichum spaethianum TaxID=700344 RepID=A0AA37LBU8_9PEZI|nr:uncharacterized protein ColSpa_05798 [Colletotrichum spaethianum]GKT45617.1 hypothetical protein ColSpa_05798 [Colletotrichum spaethianum]